MHPSASKDCSILVTDACSNDLPTLACASSEVHEEHNVKYSTSANVAPSNSSGIAGSDSGDLTLLGALRGAKGKAYRGTSDSGTDNETFRDKRRRIDGIFLFNNKECVDSNSACSEKHGDSMNPILSMIDHIDVPEVDLIASSSSHVPSSVINQPRNIDINKKRDSAACLAKFSIVKEELPYKRAKFKDKITAPFTGDRFNPCNIESEEVSLSLDFAQDAPT